MEQTKELKDIISEKKDFKNIISINLTNPALMLECGIKSDELSKQHIANSFIHNFMFSVNRQRRIGGVDTKNCGWITC